MKTKLVLIKTFWVMVRRAEGLSLFFPFDQFLADFFREKIIRRDRCVRCSVFGTEVEPTEDKLFSPSYVNSSRE